MVETQAFRDVDYSYDALGRRIEMIRYGEDPDETTRFYYDGRRVIEEYDVKVLSALSYRARHHPHSSSISWGKGSSGHPSHRDLGLQ